MRDPVQRTNASRYARGAAGKATARRTDAGGAPKPSLPPATSLAALPDLVAEKMAGFDTMRLEWTQIRDYTVTTIQECLIERRIAPENLTSPRLDIAVPALEAMRYSGLKKEFALLIAATMDVATADEAHPAFVEILKQLTLDEVNLISSLPPPGQVAPMANLYHLDRADHVRASMRRIIPAAFAARCSRRGAIPGYIDNMIRLSLIDSPSRLKIDEERFYRDLLAQDFVTDHCARMPGVLRPSIERAVLTLTDFGSQFRRCCVLAAEPAPQLTRP